MFPIEASGDSQYIYITSCELQGKIHVYDKSGKLLHQFGELQYPAGKAVLMELTSVGVALAANGNLVVADSCKHRIQLFCTM